MQTDRLFACDAVLMGGRTYLPGLRCGVDASRCGRRAASVDQAADLRLPRRQK